MSRDPHRAGSDAASQTFELEDLRGEVVSRWRPPDLETQIRRLIDPAIDGETVHWGRNYLYRTHLETPEGRLDVVVKQFRNHGLRGRLRRRLGGSKASRSWHNARALVAAGLKTADPVLLIESKRPDGPSFFVTRHLGEVTEARYLLRAANRHLEAEKFPELDMRGFLEALGRALRQMHEAGFFHRDLSIGNVLFRAGEPVHGPGDLYLIDLNRARRKPHLSLGERTRDLCRLAIFRPQHQRIFLDAYWGAPGAGPIQRAVYRLYHYGFRYRIEAKNRLRGWTRKLGTPSAVLSDSFVSGVCGNENEFLKC